jgi:hypothetical protein
MERDGVLKRSAGGTSTLMLMRRIYLSVNN